jgi:GNAT superfamily N-acetyltransferase
MLKIRQATRLDYRGIAKVQVDSWKTTYAGIVPDAYLKSLNYDDKEKIWTRILEQGFEYSCTYVVENESNEIIGFASGGKERSGKYTFDAELYTIYLLKGYQGNGLGKRLFSIVCSDLYEKGYSSLLVWFLKDNPSRKFYESLKPEIVDKATILISGVSLEEYAYGWKNTQSFR